MDDTLAILKKFKKRYGETIGELGKKVAPPKRMPTGVLEFDIATGGGIPVGDLVVIWGDEDTGKSTLVYVLMANYQRLNPGKIVAFMDLETNYDSLYGEQIGIDESRLLNLVPDCAEDAADMILELVDNGENIGLLVLDSLATMVPKKDVEKSFDDGPPVGTAGLLVSRLLRKTNNALMKRKKQDIDPMTVVFINQMRMKIGAMGDPATMPGGKAPGFFASMIIRLWRGKEIVEAEHDPNRPVKKNVLGVIQKKKGPIVCKKFEYDMAIIPHAGLRVGQTDDWKFAAMHLQEAGYFGKDGGGWFILDQKFPTKKACRAWYEGNRDKVREVLIQYLTDNPNEI
jgi:protein RecA